MSVPFYLFQIQLFANVIDPDAVLKRLKPDAFPSEKIPVRPLDKKLSSPAKKQLTQRTERSKKRLEKNEKPKSRCCLDE